MIWSRAAVHYLIDVSQSPGYNDYGVVRGAPPKFDRVKPGPSTGEFEIPDDAVRATECQKLLEDLRALVGIQNESASSLEQIVVFAENGDSIAIIGNIYGYPDATTTATARNANELVLRKAVLRTGSFRDIPYILLGDANIDPGASTAIMTAVANDLVFDVA